MIPRQGFLDGWSAQNAYTLLKQRSTITALLARLQDPSERTSPTGLFRQVYRHTFALACPPGSKSVPLEQAVEYWRVLFGEAGARWNGVQTDWLGLWVEFVTERWRRSVNRDQWDQTLVFMGRTMEDESLAFWSEESSWPAVVDEFVGFVKERRGGSGDTGETMQVD